LKFCLDNGVHFTFFEVSSNPPIEKTPSPNLSAKDPDEKKILLFPPDKSEKDLLPYSVNRDTKGALKSEELFIPSKKHRQNRKRSGETSDKQWLSPGIRPTLPCSELSF
jgi:hypothetical protein